ncbi:glycosyltransferase [Siphonobacter aquaeclarae]|uniref:Glycosyltransferase involved in cell wall bisynthesis n=1 Tax=Siphonobacter aquaeclarae TaxID=563176 RepID=A0A1G9YLU3_9BACT|nr:glycosyltransferase [Siphonobacter aquaeclarae]SDN10124.1 Glycosyltransferase involved in cell wall bisynthesis [Siphonobacter aquaeclarae]
MHEVSSPFWQSSELSTDSRPEVLILSSYPPRECGIATFSQDLLKAIERKFSRAFSLKIGALETNLPLSGYPAEVKFRLNTSKSGQYSSIARAINADPHIELVVVQHEFGFFLPSGESDFITLLELISKPVILVFHTILADPDVRIAAQVRKMAMLSDWVVVMTHHSAQLLADVYGIEPEKVEIIPHGTHLVRHRNPDSLKQKYGLRGKKVLSTFGLLGPGKGIETTLQALPAIIRVHPEVCFLVIGKTHPGVVLENGEKYREELREMVRVLGIGEYVRFINAYLSLPVLLEYLQLTDIYLFTSLDPGQSVSGTFSYAMSCGCAIISTPIPHALEVLSQEAGVISAFRDPVQLAGEAIPLLARKEARISIGLRALQKMVPTAWENVAIAYARLFAKTLKSVPRLKFDLPPIELHHLRYLTTESGMIQFSKANKPDLSTGYTLDDNARALIAICMHYELTGDDTDLPLLGVYLNFMETCQQDDGSFLNYVDEAGVFTSQNDECNLDDANGRALWALGFLLSRHGILPQVYSGRADKIFRKAASYWTDVHSTRAMAFAIKGFYHFLTENHSEEYEEMLELLAQRMERMYLHEAETKWSWYESYLTYGNSVLPEAMLCAYLQTGRESYRQIAIESFDFLLGRTFGGEGINVIPNQQWLKKGEEVTGFGEQPIDVAYTILALSLFGETFAEERYFMRMNEAFAWFLGKNRLNQIIYNPCTGGCYDGLEETQVNLNQGAESTVSCLMARLVIEEYQNRTEGTLETILSGGRDGIEESIHPNGIASL